MAMDFKSDSISRYVTYVIHGQEMEEDEYEE